MKHPSAEDTAYFATLTTQLTVIPGFENPKPLALGVVTEFLLERCNDRDQGKRIVTRAVSWQKWRGIYGLRELLDDDDPPIPANHAKDYGPRPAVDCQLCQDRGIIEHAGEAQWCECEFGQDQKSKYPNLINAAKKKAYNLAQLTGAKPQPEPRRLTEADLEIFRRAKPDRTAELIAQAEATLADQTASPDRKEIAREILRGAGPSREIN